MGSATQTSPAKTEWQPKVSPWLVAATTALPAFMVTLDTSVANISLPRIAASMSSQAVNTTAVLTGYLVANAIILPATGWLSQFFGRKRLLITSIGLFTLASVLCGAAWSLPVLIVARVLQGASGGVLPPVAQAIPLESFPHSRRGDAMAVYGITSIVGPIIGPMLGGWITDHYSWRWVFYINVPVGLVGIVLALAILSDPPYVRNLVRSGIDYLGFAAMAVGLGTLQFLLDEGRQHDWFATASIRWLALISAAALAAFVRREFATAHPIVNLRILRNRNFSVGVAMIGVYGAVLYGSLVLLPLLLQDLLGFPAAQTGFAMTPRGVGAMISMFIAGRIVRRTEGRILIVGGFLMLAWGSFLLGNVSLDIGLSYVMWPNLLMGMGLGFVFVPLTTIAMGSLPNEQLGTATGIYNLMRNMGGSIGIAGVTTVLSRSTQAHYAGVVRMHGTLLPMLARKASVAAFVDTFHLLAYLSLAILLLTFLWRRACPAKEPDGLLVEVQ